MDPVNVTIPSEKVINDYIKSMDEQLQTACDILLKWNYAIKCQNPKDIHKKTKCMCLFQILHLVKLSRAIQQYCFSALNLKYITELYNFIYGIKFNKTDFDCFCFSSMSTAYFSLFSYRFPNFR